MVILDAGCGTGMTLCDIRDIAIPIGVDRSLDALGYAKRRAEKFLACGDVCALPFKDGSFDAVTILGVLYNKNVARDDNAVKESFRVLKKDGIVIIDEAAYKSLMSKFNVSVDGARRYTRSELKSKMEKCGFRILKSSYWNILMLPIFYLSVFLEDHITKDTPAIKLKKLPATWNAALTYILFVEAILMRFIDIPFGPSVILVGKKL